MKKAVVLLILLSISLVAVYWPKTAGAVEDMFKLTEIPPDLKIIAVSGGVVPSTPMYKVEIDAKGKGVYYHISAENREKGLYAKPKKFKLDEEDLKFLCASIRSNKFFSLKSEYIDKQVLDGSFAQLTITMDGKPHSVRTQNIAVERFDKIMIAINIITPPKNDIIYNEILR